MIALLQRVSSSQVIVNHQCVGKIDQGVLVLLGVQPHDGEEEANRMVDKILGYRMFSDDQGKMNLSVKAIRGGVLLVPQFTLVANTKKGMRPSFSCVADPALGEQLFLYIHDRLRGQHENVATGVFGADMKVSLVNDGPVTFWLEV